MNALLQRLRDAGEDVIRRALAWWFAELAALIPGRFRTKHGQARAVLDVTEDGAAMVFNRRGSGPPTRVAIDAGDTQAARAAAQAAMRSRRLGRTVIIRLDPSLVLQAGLTLPVGAERAMRPILENQLERVVPLPADQVDFAYSVAPRTSDAKSLRVQLTIVTHAAIDRAVQLAHSLGLTPRLAIADSAAPWSTAPVVLWRAGRTAGNTPGQRRLRRLLEIIAILLLLAAYGGYLYRLDARVDELREDVRDRSKLAAAARDLTKQQQETEGALEMLRARKAERTPLALLDAVTLMIPEDTWVMQMSVRNPTIEIVGISPSVASLVTKIEKHDMFWGVQFRSPITPAPDGKGQRFNLSFQLRSPKVGGRATW